MMHRVIGVRGGIVFLFCLLSGQKPAAQTLLSGHFEKQPLTKVFKTLEKKYNLAIAYDPGQVKAYSVTADFQQKSMQDAFGLILKNLPLRAEIVTQRYIIIVEQEIAPPPLENITLSGRLSDRATGEPLPFGAVYAQSAGRGAVADSLGFFKITLPADRAGADTLLARYPGYQPLKIRVDDWQKLPAQKLRLQAAENRLLEVVISNKALDAITLSTALGAESRIQPDRPGQVPALGEPDPFRMVQFLPGISAEGDKAGDLQVRGGRPDQNAVSWEGIPLYQTSHILGYSSALNPFLVNRMDIWKGTPKADKGGRVSGYVDMYSDYSYIAKPTLLIGGSQLNGYIVAHAPLFKQKAVVTIASRGGSSWRDRVAGELVSGSDPNQLGYLLQLLGGGFPKDSLTIYRGATFNDNNLKIAWKISARSNLSFAWHYTLDLEHFRDTIRTLPDFKASENTRAEQAGASLRFNTVFKSGWHSELLLAEARYQNRYQTSWRIDSSGTEAQDIRNRLDDFSIKWHNSVPLNRQNEIQLGLHMSWWSTRDQDIHSAPSDSAVTLRRNNQHVLYGQWEYQPGSHWIISAGGRLLWAPGSERGFYADPNVQLHWTPVDNLTVYGNAGTQRQWIRRIHPPGVLSGNGLKWEIQNAGFQAISGRQLSLGAGIDQAGWWLSVEGFWRQIRPLSGEAVQVNGQLFSEGPVESSETVYGLECLARKRWGHYVTTLSYTAMHAGARVDLSGETRWYPSDRQRTQIFKWNHHLGWKHWDISGAWIFQSGNPFTEASGTNGSLQWASSSGGRLAPYMRLDCSVQYLFYAKWMRGGIGFTYFNVLNRRNPDLRQSFLIGQSDIYQHDILLPGSILNLMVAVKF